MLSHVIVINLLVAWIFISTDAILQGKKATCNEEGAEVHVPLIADDPCIKCFCKKGLVECEKNKCPSMEGCLMVLFQKPKGSCCDACKGCSENGVSYRSGQSWSASENHCQVKQCQAGVITTSSSVCPKLNCSNPVQLKGQCCPSCQTCQLGEVTYNDGQTFQPFKDSCVQCHCKDSQLTCVKNSCPVLNCPESKIEHLKSQCCPVCVGSRKVFNVPSMCLFRNKMYQQGQTVTLDDCTTCTCRKGTMMCSKNTCPVIDCSPDMQIYESRSSCCPFCQKKVISSCSYEGHVYEHGESWKDKCADCSCTNGTVTCHKVQCDAEQFCPLATHDLRFYPGECCPRCEERYGMCTVFGDPHYSTFDKKIYDFQGTCQYLLAKDCIDNSFRVYVKNYDRYNMPGAWTKSVTVLIKSTKIGLFRNGKVRINKSQVSLPFVKVGHFSVKYEGFSLVLESPVGLKIIWNTESYLELHVSPKYKRNMCGLCGNFNSIDHDDFIGQDNQLHRDSGSFANTWAHGKKSGKCKSGVTQQQVQDKCKDNFSKWRRAHSECAILKSQSLKKCRAKVKVEPYFRSCVTDSCNCPKHRSCTCDAVTAYVRECERNGIYTDIPREFSCSRQQRRIQQRVMRQLLA